MRFISSSYIILALDGFGYIHGKGLAVIGGKGNREVCPDCPDNYNAEELTWALITLAIVTGLFLSICFCRFYPKIRQLFSSDGSIARKPCHCNTVHRGSNATQTCSSAKQSIAQRTSSGPYSPSARLSVSSYPPSLTQFPSPPFFYKNTSQGNMKQQNMRSTSPPINSQPPNLYSRELMRDKTMSPSVPTSVSSTTVYTSHI